MTEYLSYKLSLFCTETPLTLQLQLVCTWFPLTVQLRLSTQTLLEIQLVRTETHLAIRLVFT